MAHASEAIDVYRKYGRALRRKAERILLSSDDAGDIVQELFVDIVARNTPNVDLPYLYRAVTNRCLNLIRDRDNRRRLLDLQQPTLRGAARSRCDDQVIGLDLIARLSDSLDDDCLEVLVCRFVDDMSQQETAELLGTSRKTIGKRIQKIRAELAQLARAGSEGGA